MKCKILPICMLVLLTTFAQVFAQRPFFNKNTDILIAQFDSKPDPDDIHAQAALGCMLAHPDLAGVNYYAVAGAVGTQNGQFIDSDALFDMAFGSSNWTDANANWSASVTNIKNKVIPILQNGGKVWVQEAGQSNITADWIAQVLQTVASNTVKNNVVVVQHSNWNENNTTASDLSYVKDKTWYFAIDDGNAPDGAGWGDRGPWGTPEYRAKSNTWIAQAKSSVNPKANQLWTEADNIIDTLWPNGYPHDWSFIHFDGVDYSDCAENWWIFNIGTDADSTSKFWSRYVTNTPSNVNVTGVTVSPATVSINVGQTGNLTASVLPSNATDKSVSWSSGNSSIATVNASGVVSGLAVGTTTITATTTDGGFIDTSSITVSNVPPGGNISIGNATNTNAGVDGWKSNLVINESETYTNTTGASQTLNVDQFVFYANRKADPVTPFVVKVNANDDFTVLAVGTSRASSAYNVGENTVAFNTGTAKQITLANGETIAPGFLDANANGSGGNVGSVIPFDSNSPADQIWYSGGAASGNSASVTEGAAPTGGASTITTLTRNYRFKINLSVASSGGASQTVTLSPIHDAYTQDGTNQNNTLVRLENAGRVRIGYLQYDLSGINGTISSAELKMTCNSDAGNSALVISAALGNNNNWTEGNVSSANAPSSSGTLGTKQGPFNKGSTYTWDLNTNSLSGGGNVSLILTASGSTDDVAFASKENSVTEPQLVITYNTSSASKAGKFTGITSSESPILETPKKAKLYPNPISVGVFKINFYGNDSLKKVNIFDIMGRQIYKTITVENQLTLDSNIFTSKGLYFVNISSSNSIQRIKAVVK